MTSAGSVQVSNNLPSVDYNYPTSPNLAGSSEGVVTNAMGMQNRIDQILGISDANSAFNLASADSANALQSKWYNQSMEYNAVEAQKNRDWQEYLSNTAHQREVQDLIKAGLNPVLSASGGNGATVGSGATASVVSPQAQKAQADTSGSTAIVSLLGHSLDAMTKIANTNTSAMANMAIADKYNMMNKYLGEMSVINEKDLAHIYGKYGLAQAETSGLYNLNAAQTSAGAMLGAASMNAAAARYAADSTRQYQNYRTDKDYASSIYKADQDFQAKRLAAELGWDSSIYASDTASANGDKSLIGSLIRTLASLA